MSGRGETVYVYVLETGCYDQSFIKGVYATPEEAMAAHAPKRPAGHGGVRGSEYGPLHAGKPWSYEWSGPDKDGGYGFGADWGDAAGITRYEVQGAADTASATETAEQSPPSTSSGEGSCSGVSG